MDDDRSVLLEEYRTLRSEIEHAYQTRLQILAFSGTAWAALVAWFIANRQFFFGELAVALLHVPLLLGYVLVKLCDRHVMRISTYIREFIESAIPGLRWETRVSTFQQYSRRVFSTGQVTVVALLFMSIASAIAPRLMRVPAQFERAPNADLLLLTVLWLYLAAKELPLVSRLGSRSYEQTAAEIWSRIRSTPEDPRTELRKQSKPQ